jgi:excinuclease ABC subunit A
VGRGDAASMVEQILTLLPDSKFLVLAPIIENRKGEHRDYFEELRKEGFARVRIDGVVRELSDVQSLAKHKKHSIEVVIDRLVVKSGASFRQRVTDSVETALRMAHGQLIVHVLGREDIRMSEARSCCGFAFPELDPPLFSFNSPQGMCPSCNGLGSVLAMDAIKVIPNPDLSIREGAVRPWRNNFDDQGNEREGSWGLELIRAMEREWGIDLDLPWKKIPANKRKLILHGSMGKGLELTTKWQGNSGYSEWTREYEGLLNTLYRRFQQTKSDSMRTWYSRFMSSQPCKTCNGMRLKQEVLAVRIEDHSIIDTTQLTIQETYAFLASLKLNGSQKLIAQELLKEIVSRLSFLLNVGLSYLSLDRKGPTLSGGEAQRIRLASQIGSELTGVLYILDEPSIGLHQRDNQKLLDTLCHLRDIGNTVLVVEHDQETMESADWILDFGPGAGHLGGQIVASGTPAQIRRDKHSPTGRYLSGKDQIAIPKTRRVPDDCGNRWIEVIGASANNLSDLNARIPVGLLTCVTGVSGAGKSTLINQILYPALAATLHDSTREVGKHKRIKGLAYLDKVISISQAPIGRTPRSNPATYTKLFDPIRDLFAMLPEARTRGYKKGRFSFNVKGGRCEHCSGDGYITVEMHFLADVYVPCDACKGRRFNKSTLEIVYKSQSIADVLDLSVLEAYELFKNHPKISKILQTLIDVGLSYVKLGQAATTLSGGEAQRIKLARELAKRDTGQTLYILDEPTTGLHFADIEKLLAVLQRLVHAGNTVVVIEHNLDVIKTADWLIDMGPEGGDAGGLIIAEGSPETVAKEKKSHTGQYLHGILQEFL